MTTIDHQQAAVQAGAQALADDWNPDRDPVLTAMFSDYSATALAAATPHLRAAWAEELLDDTPGSPLTRGYQRLMDPKTGEHPVRTWEAAVGVMLDTLLEGGGE